MKFITRYRDIIITKWSGQYYIGPNPENRNPLFHCYSLQDVIDFIDHLSPKPSARGLFHSNLSSTICQNSILIVIAFQWAQKSSVQKGMSFTQ